MIEAAFLALVIGVHDGDTLTVRAQDGPRRAIRIARIDAPELRQPWGSASRDALARQCLGMWAWVQPASTDRYGRTVANVTCRKGVDVSARQVERGMAWVYVRFEPAGSPIYALEQRAQHYRRGMWSAPEPQSPWEFRTRK